MIAVLGLIDIYPGFTPSGTSGPQHSVPRNDSEIKPLVVTSFYPVYFFVKEIGGDKVNVINITPSGVEPHDYEPTARDLVQIQKSKLVFINGGGFESWATKIAKDGAKVVELATGLMENNDPHVWLSPELAKKEVEMITMELIRMDESNSRYYLENQTVILAKLDKLSADFKVGLSQCKEHKVVTSHDAFGYLTREYGLTQISISGISPDEEPSTKQLVEISNLAKKENLKYIFFEKLVSPKLAQTVAEEIGAKTLVLDPIEGISDNDAKQGKNYLTLMEENLANLKIALECR